MTTNNFNTELMDYLNYVSTNSKDANLKKGADKALQIIKEPKKNYTGTIDYINGAKSVNNSKVGTSTPNNVLSSIFDAKNNARDAELANKKAMDEKAKVDAENKAKTDAENAKADKLRKRKMHQQALVSSRVSSGNQQPQMPMQMM